MQITVYACDECGKERRDEFLDIAFSLRHVKFNEPGFAETGDFCSIKCARAWFEKLLDKIEKEGR